MPITPKYRKTKQNKTKSQNKKTKPKQLSYESLYGSPDKGMDIRKDCYSVHRLFKCCPCLFPSVVQDRLCIAFSCHVSTIFSLEVSPSFLPFVSLADLKSSGLLCCRMTFNLGASDVFSWVAPGHLFILDGNTTDRTLCLHPVVWSMCASLPPHIVTISV